MVSDSNGDLFKPVTQEAIDSVPKLLMIDKLIIEPDVAKKIMKGSGS